MYSGLTSNLPGASYLSLPKAGLTSMCHHHIWLYLVELASVQPRLLRFVKLVIQWSIDGLHFTRWHEARIKKVLEDLDIILGKRLTEATSFGTLVFWDFEDTSSVSSAHVRLTTPQPHVTPVLGDQVIQLPLLASEFSIHSQ